VAELHAKRDRAGTRADDADLQPVAGNRHPLPIDPALQRCTDV
jgi:hypothetical protein